MLFPNLQFDLSCKNTKQNLGAMFTRTNYVTLKYVTDAWGTESNGFKLVVTAVKDPSEYLLIFIATIGRGSISRYANASPLELIKNSLASSQEIVRMSDYWKRVSVPEHACTEFRCNLREFCIATDLVCDNVNHCADGSDELSPTVCQSKLIILRCIPEQTTEILTSSSLNKCVQINILIKLQIFNSV